MSASLRIELLLSQIINPKLEVQYFLHQSDLTPKKKSSGTIFSHPVLCSTIKNPALARVDPMASFNTFASLDLHSVLGLLWPVMRHSGPRKKCKVRAKFNKKRRLIEALFFNPSQPKFAQLRSSFNAFTARTAEGCIFEVKLSITKRSNWRSGAMVKMS